MAKDTLRSVAISAGAARLMDQGKLHIVDERKPVQGQDALILNSTTGMIGRPEQTEDGIIVRSLINPAFGVNGLVQIDQASIQQATPDYQNAASEALQRNLALPTAGFIAADGIYRIIFMDTQGDTRGPEWYQTMTVLSVSGGAPSVADFHASPFPGPYVGQS